MSLKWKFIGFVAGLLVFTIAILSMLVLKGVSDDQRRQTESSLEQQTGTANLHIRQQFVTGARLEPKSFMQLQGQKLAVELGSISGMRVILYDSDGMAVGDSLPMAAKTDVSDALQPALQNKIAYITEGDTLQYLAPLQGPDGQIGVIQYEASLLAQRAFYRNILSLFVFGGLIVLVISFVLGGYYMSRQANAVGQLKKAADRIREGERLAEPVLKRKDELGDLSLGIFEMSEAIQSNLQALEGEQAKMRQALRKLQELEQQQKHFINNISHEFKTPLTSIKAYTDLLDMYEDDPTLLRDAREAISRESGRLYDLVEKVLKLAALEKYEFEHQPGPVELAALLDDISDRMKGKADKFGVSIFKQLEPVIIWADRESVIHIAINLLDNAIKYNVENGSVTVKCHVVGERAEVVFEDTGVGIPVEGRDQLFEPFYTLNKDRARQSGGSGLGLALVKQLVEKQAGTIRIEGSEGQGTMVTVTFPIYLP
ncbi:HAMP domain-containing sensor histidine kinase [Paenibacillus sp. RC67]|uniref:sensor histidine kinase n=1 Tax=Paenibacillus sp. RC67 TaxID=3039392 RepID=UPI0024AD19FE|nr:HAMP domain-containing sensor histidine kinase [Paenibacillus sp. RC67]